MTTEEFENQVNTHKDKLYRMAYAMLLDREAAKDIVQEVFMALWLKRKTVHRLKSIEAWCITVTKNKCINSLKKQKTARLYTTSSEKIIHKPDDYLQAKELEMIIKSIMLKLSGTQRAVLHLRDHEHLDYESIGKRLKISKSNVKIQVFRARKFINSELKRIYGHE